MPRWLDAKRVTFKYGLGDGLHWRAQDAPHARARLDDEVSVGVEKVSPRDVVAACLPDRP